MAVILLVEDDPVLVEGMREAFIFHDHRLLAAGNGLAALRLLEESRPDLAILDVMLPGADGFEVCRRLRDRRPDLPVIFLTARGGESDKLLGFASGGDDYLTKPFSMAELLARVGAVLRRGASGQQPVPLRIGPARVDLQGFTVSRSGHEFTLTPKERDILKLLAENPHRVFSRDEILDRVWGEAYSPVPKTVDNFILKLRSMIEEEPRRPRHLISLHGAGYKFVP